MARPRATTTASLRWRRPARLPALLRRLLAFRMPHAVPCRRRRRPQLPPLALVPAGETRDQEFYAPRRPRCHVHHRRPEELAASHLDSLKRRLDALHGASNRISKRVKMQSHGCLQLAEEVDKEQKKMADKIAEHAELVKTSYKKFVAEVQASTSRVCKVTVPEMAKSAERTTDGLRSRYNISATPSA